MIFKLLKKQVEPQWEDGMRRSGEWAGGIVGSLKPAALLDVGCGDGSKLDPYLKPRPALYCGIEASPTHKALAEKNGLKVTSVDLNGRWSYPDNTFDVVHSSFVIEHVHHTRLFLMEAFRVLKPGGTAVITTENLCSILNWGAMTLGYTPFSLIHCCGWFLGNPLGLHYHGDWTEHVAIDDPAFPGVNGHVRVLGVMQAHELADRVGFQSEVRSIGLMPIPEFIGKPLERFAYRRGHFLLMRLKKPV